MFPSLTKQQEQNVKDASSSIDSDRFLKISMMAKAKNEYRQLNKQLVTYNKNPKRFVDEVIKAKNFDFDKMNRDELWDLHDKIKDFETVFARDKYVNTLTPNPEYQKVKQKIEARVSRYPKPNIHTLESAESRFRERNEEYKRKQQEMAATTSQSSRPAKKQRTDKPEFTLRAQKILGLNKNNKPIKPRRPRQPKEKPMPELELEPERLNVGGKRPVSAGKRLPASKTTINQQQRQRKELESIKKVISDIFTKISEHDLEKVTRRDIKNHLSMIFSESSMQMFKDEIRQTIDSEYLIAQNIASENRKEKKQDERQDAFIMNEILEPYPSTIVIGDDDDDAADEMSTHRNQREVQEINNKWKEQMRRSEGHNNKPQSLNPIRKTLNEQTGKKESEFGLAHKTIQLMARDMLFKFAKVEHEMGNIVPISRISTQSIVILHVLIEKYIENIIKALVSVQQMAPQVEKYKVSLAGLQALGPSIANEIESRAVMDMCQYFKENNHMNVVDPSDPNDLF